MNPYLTLTLAGGLLAGLAVPAFSQAPPDLRALGEHRVALAKQCPAPPVVSAAEAAKRPIHVTRWGSKGPTVLLVHGGVQGGAGGGPATMDKQEALAAKGWRVVRVDRPGFGKSKTRGVDDMEVDSQWIAAMLGSSANLVAHSWGGAEALLAAARRPQAVRSLILVEPALQPLTAGDPSVMADPAVRADAGKTLAMIMASQNPRDYGSGFTHGLGPASFGGTAPNASAAALDAHPEAASAMGCALLLGHMASPEALRAAADTVAKAGIPVLVISGGWSPANDATAELAAKLLHGRHVIVKSPNHFVQMASADEFNKVVDGFMREAEHKRPAH